MTLLGTTADQRGQVRHPVEQIVDVATRIVPADAAKAPLP
jgi:hypothetical protein